MNIKINLRDWIPRKDGEQKASGGKQLLFQNFFLRSSDHCPLESSHLGSTLLNSWLKFELPQWLLLVLIKVLVRSSQVVYGEVNLTICPKVHWMNNNYQMLLSNTVISFFLFACVFPIFSGLFHRFASLLPLPTHLTPFLFSWLVLKAPTFALLPMRCGIAHPLPDKDFSTPRS